MKIKPVDHRILIQLYFPDESEIILPDTNFSPSVEAQRTRAECVEIGPEVTVCGPGDFLLLHSDVLRNAIPISKEPPTMLIHDSQVIALVLDDAQHVR